MRPYRKERVASIILQIVSETIARGMQDPRVSCLTTITRVEISPDLLLATVYITVMGTKGDERKTLSALRHAKGHIQRTLAAELNIRQCPKLQFEVDEVAKKVQETMRILAENRQEALDRPEAQSGDETAEGRAAGEESSGAQEPEPTRKEADG